ncbi:MAG: hypothetical protein ACYDEJ_15325 [Desulfitobacteriaceae bacterium]
MSQAAISSSWSASESVLASLVGDRVEEMVCVFSSILRSFLVAMHEEGGLDNVISIDSEIDSSEPDSYCVHPSVDACPSPVSQGEYRAPVCATGESIESGLERESSSNYRRGLRHFRCPQVQPSRVSAFSRSGFFGTGGSHLWLGSLPLGPFIGRFTSTARDMCTLRYHRYRRRCFYDLNEFNDRLILGFKGTMSEAELHFLRARLIGGKKNKAHKGELHFPLPVGYCFDSDGSTTMDPDEAFQTAVRHIFTSFQASGSAYGVVKFFATNGLQFPKRGLWRRLGWQTDLGHFNSFPGAWCFV